MPLCYPVIAGGSDVAGVYSERMGTMEPGTLVGGPEDGLKVQMPGPVDSPIEHFVLPACMSHGTAVGDDQLPPLLCYERGELGADGRWRYVYLGIEPMRAQRLEPNEV